MKHSVSLTKQYDELPPVYCFPMQLKQVFMNLIVNAYQAIEASGGGDGARGEIHLRTELRGEAIAILVTDNGTGIAPDALDRIFDPVLHHQGGGGGNGPRTLDLLQHRAPPRRDDPGREHRGAGNHLRGPPAAGCARSGGGDGGVSGSGSPPVLLLVDDETRILSALRRTLRREGYEILTAESVAEGLRILESREVDLVLTDQKMPGMSGLEFLAQVADRYPECGSPPDHRMARRDSSRPDRATRDSRPDPQALGRPGAQIGPPREQLAGLSHSLGRRLRYSRSAFWVFLAPMARIR